MKLNRKLLFLLTILILFFVIVFLTVSNTIFTSGYDKLEEEYALFEYNRVYNEFDNYKNKLNMIIEDWSIWDDTYYFIEEESTKFIESNLVKSTYENIGLDYISRLGGDEFVLVLSNTNAENAEIITNRIQNSIKDFNEISDKNYFVSISLGIIEYNGIETLDELIERADFKMYENKILIKSKLRNILK